MTLRPSGRTRAGAGTVDAVPAPAAVRARSPRWAVPPVTSVLLPVLLPALLAGCGGSTPEVRVTGVPTASVPPVVVPVEMLDRAFSPATFRFVQGSVVVFRFHNGTRERHQAAVGDVYFQQDRAGGQLDPNDPLVNTVVVEPGATADLPYRMDVPGELLIGCHEPGHWEAGMKATVTVTPAA